MEHDRPAPRRADRRSVQRAGQRRGRGRTDGRRRDRHGDAADPRSAATRPPGTRCPAAPSSCCAIRDQWERAGRNDRRPAPRRDRGDAALDVAGEEHGPQRDRRHRRSTAPTSSKGEKIILLFESANFDEAVFGDPENFRIDRNPNSHMAFGFGTHFCLGNQLARLELSMMTRRVLQRLPDLRLADDAELPLRPANFVSGPEEMPVVFTPTARVLDAFSAASVRCTAKIAANSSQWLHVRRAPARRRAVARMSPSRCHRDVTRMIDPSQCSVNVIVPVGCLC